MPTVKTLSILAGIAIIIGIAVAIVTNLVAEDPSSTVVALVSGAIAGLVVALVMRPVERYFRSDDG